MLDESSVRAVAEKYLWGRRILSTERARLASTHTTAKLPHMILVVIPAYNEEVSIAETLEQLIAVTDDMAEIAEIILVDDGSTDDTTEIASRYDVEIIEQETNKGYGASLKTGIRAVTTEYIE